jgi:hypothetical protein
MRILIVMGLLAALAGCQHKAPRPAGAPLAAWEPVDQTFTGCEGG